MPRSGRRHDGQGIRPGDPDEPLLAWFNAVINEHQHDIAATIEAVGDVAWDLPVSRRWAARRLVNMWEKGGIDAFGEMPSALAKRT